MNFKFFLYLILLAGLSASAYGVDDTSHSRQTIISRMVVPLFKIQTTDASLNSLWMKRRVDIQRTFADLLNSQSSFQSVVAIREYGLDTPQDQIISETMTDGGDGVLVGEFDGQNLKIEIMGTISGRILAKIRFPMTNINQDTNELVSPIVNFIIASFRYSGFIISTHHNEAKINIGKNQGVINGARYAIYDFVGDKPVFTSPIRKIGELLITKVSENASLGKIIVATTPIPAFSKVQLMHERKAALAPEKQVEKSAPIEPPPTKDNQDGFWISGGIDYLSINSVAANGTPALIQQRLFEVPLSIAPEIEIGYSRFSLDAIFTALSNSSNSVSYIELTGLAKVYDIKTSSLNMLTSAGLYYSNYGVTPSSNATNILVNTSTFAPTFEETFQMVAGLIKDAHLSLQLFFPIFASDSANGSSISYQSLGGGTEVGYRYSFTDNLKLDLGARSHFFSISNQSGSRFQEFEFLLLAHMTYLF